MALRFAANLSFLFQDLAFEDRFAAAAAAGFPAVEFLFPYDWPKERLARLLADNGLTLALFNLPPGDWAAGERGLAALPDRRDEFEAGVRSALDYATHLGVTRLHMMAGLADPANGDALEAYRANLALAAGMAAPFGIDILIEPINRRDMPGYFLSDFELAAAILRDIGLANAKLQFDIYHRQIIAGDVIHALDRVIDIIGHVQVASVPHRNEPGSGELHDMAIFRHLDSLGYSGFIGCEYRPKAGTVEGLGWMGQAMDAG